MSAYIVRNSEDNSRHFVGAACEQGLFEHVIVCIYSLELRNFAKFISYLTSFIKQYFGASKQFMEPAHSRCGIFISTSTGC